MASAAAPAASGHKKAKTITGAAAARRAGEEHRRARLAPASTLVQQQRQYEEADGEAQAVEIVEEEEVEEEEDPILARLLEASAQTLSKKGGKGRPAAAAAAAAEGKEAPAPAPAPPPAAAAAEEMAEAEVEVMAAVPPAAAPASSSSAAAAAAAAPPAVPPPPTAAAGARLEADAEAFVDAGAWRAEEGQGAAGPAPPARPVPDNGGGGGGGNDIRRFLPLAPPPPPRRRCPALPLPPAPKPYPANRFWRQALVARPYDRRGERAATRAAITHLLVRRLRPFSSCPPPPPPPPPPQPEAAAATTITSTLGGSFAGAVTLAAGMTGATVADPPSDMAFDPLGALLAVGTTHGAVRVYDFDEVLSAARHGLCATSRAAVVSGQGGGGRTEAVHPLQVLEPRKAVSAVRWNPRRDSEVAVAFWHWAEVFVYDLETWSSAPTRVHRVGHRVKGAAGGNYSLAFVTVPGWGRGARGGGVTTLVAGSAYGVLRGWGMAAPDAVAWEVRTRGNGAITHLCPAGASGLLVGATASPEAIYVWDLANLQTPILGATPAPPLLHSIDVHGLVRGLGCPSPSTDTVLVTTDTGLLLHLDPRTGRVRARQFVGRHDLAATARLPGGVDAVITHDSAAAAAAATSTDPAAAPAAAAGPAALAAATTVECPTAVYTPAGSALAASFPLRRPGPVGYRETGDAEAEAQDAATEAAMAAAAAATAAASSAEDGKAEAEGEKKEKEAAGGGGGKEGMSAAAFDVTLPGVLLAAEAGGRTLRASDGALHRFLCPHPDENGVGGAGAAAASARGRRRTSYLSVEGRVYTVKDLWPVYPEAPAEEQGEEEAAAEGPPEEGKGEEPRRARLRRLVQRRQGQGQQRAVATEIELVEPFHRTVGGQEGDDPAMLGGGVRMLAALRPVFEPEGAAAAAGGGRQWAHVLGTLKPAGALGCMAVHSLTQHVVLGYAASGTYEILGCERYRRGWENEEEVAEAPAEAEAEAEARVRDAGAVVVVE